MKPLLAALLVLAFAPPAVAQAQEVRSAACPASEGLFSAGDGLARSRAAVAARRLRVLAVGSSSIEGVGASRPELGFTPLLETGLERRLPGVDVTVANRGIGGENTAGAADRLAKELSAAKPDLLLWQLGTNDALQGRTVREVLVDLRRGREIAEAAGADVLLVDPQVLPDRPGNPFRERFALLSDVTRAIRLEARRVGDALFSRSQAMASWGSLPSGGVGPDHLHFNDAGYACWAELTADDLAEALR